MAESKSSIQQISLIISSQVELIFFSVSTIQQSHISIMILISYRCSPQTHPERAGRSESEELVQPRTTVGH